MPTDNVFIEVFNGQFRQECLNEDWFLSLEGQDDCKVLFYPLMVSLSNHRWLVWASFDKLRMSRNR